MQNAYSGEIRFICHSAVFLFWNEQNIIYMLSLSLIGEVIAGTTVLSIFIKYTKKEWELVYG